MTRAEDTVWVEKFRPSTLDDLIGNEKEVAWLKDHVDDPSVPNVLLSGPQGTGKTAATVAFAKDKYGEDWKNHVLQLNASDERGIETVRTKIKNFASQGGVMGQHDFNIVMLDEVDNMTRDAQPAMRRIMEDFHDRTRFFLICNYPNKLIDPIQSRCTPLRMSRHSADQIFTLVEKVAKEENLNYTDDQLHRIAEKSEGDARAAIHTLQSATSDGEVIDDFLDAVVSEIDEKDVSAFVQRSIAGDQEEAMEMVDDFISSGVDFQELCTEIVEEILTEYEDLPADSQSLLVDKVADCEWRILNGANPGVQLRALVTDLRMARHLSMGSYNNQ